MKKTMKSKPASKSVKRSSQKASAEQNEMPDLVAVMLKVAERLDSLEKKMELVINQTNRQGNHQTQGRSSEPRFSSPSHSQNSQRPVQSQHNQRPQNQQQYPNGNRSAQPVRGMEQRQNFQQPQGQHQHQGRPERPLFKSVCADCGKHCEIPFKPTGERPVYCKECFSKRKSQGSSPKNNAPQPQMIQQKQVKVIPNGVGKVTITEMVPAAGRGNSSKKKNPKLAKKAR